jgi:hypothetical protein
MHELMQFFRFAHLPPEQREVSEGFFVLADAIMRCTDFDFEHTVGPMIDKQREVVFQLPKQNTETGWAMFKLATAREIAQGNSVVLRESRLGHILRLILEAKDCAVRSTFYEEPPA